MPQLMSPSLIIRLVLSVVVIPFCTLVLGDYSSAEEHIPRIVALGDSLTFRLRRGSP